MNPNFPSFIPIADVISLLNFIQSNIPPTDIINEAIKRGMMPETQEIINTSKSMVEIETLYEGYVVRKMFTNEKWREIKMILASENLVIDYDEDEVPITSSDFLEFSIEKIIKPDTIIGHRLQPLDCKKENLIDLMIGCIEEYKQKKLDNDKEIKLKYENENIRKRLLVTEQPQNIVVKKVDGLYVVQNSFKFVLDPPTERLVVGIYNPDKTIRRKLSDEEIMTCDILKLKIKREMDDEEEKEILSNGIDRSGNLSPPGYPYISQQPMLLKPYHKYISYLNTLSILYTTTDGLDEEVWTSDVIDRVDSLLCGNDIFKGSSESNIKTLRNMRTSYDKVIITSKNQPNKRSYTILSDHTLLDILEGTRVFAGTNTVIDHFDVDDVNTTDDCLHIVVNWLL